MLRVSLRCPRSLVATTQLSHPGLLKGQSSQTEGKNRLKEALEPHAPIPKHSPPSPYHPQAWAPNTMGLSATAAQVMSHPFTPRPASPCPLFSFSHILISITSGLLLLFSR